jgi:hypothetical protein
VNFSLGRRRFERQWRDCANCVASPPTAIRPEIADKSRLFGGGPRLVTAIGALHSLVFSVPDRALREAAADHPSLWPQLSVLVYG